MFLSVSKVSKHFGGIQAVAGCTFDVKEGEILGLIGPNGSGKTTMFNIISGLHHPDGGALKFKGEDITHWQPDARARLGIGRTFQLIRLFPKLTVMDNMLIAQKYIHGEGFWNQLLRRGHVSEEESAKREHALELLRLVKLDLKADDLAENLSYGQQKLLEIVRALAMEPQLLLLDEPIAGVNPTMTRQILALIETLHKKGLTIVIIEHNMNVMMRFCDRLVVLEGGKEIASGPPGKIRKNKKVIEAYLGGRH